MDCPQISDPDWLIAILRSDQPTAKTRVAKCFYEQYYSDWRGLAISKFIKDSNMHTARRDEFLLDAFNDGLSYFIEHIIQKGYKQRKATIKTFFFKFCINKLLNSLKADWTYGARYKNISPEAWEIVIENPDEENFVNADEKKKEEALKQLLLSKAISMLGERCIMLIIWRKLNKWSNDQIAAQLGIGAHSVNNEVFRCMGRLKKIIDGLK